MYFSDYDKYVETHEFVVSPKIKESYDLFTVVLLHYVNKGFDR